MKKSKVKSSKWLVVITVIAVFCVAAAIFYYYNFFRQDNANLVESVPNDAVFIFEVNDVAPFVKNVSKLSPYMNEIFFMGSFAGFHSFLDKLPANNSKNNSEIVVSGHQIQDKIVLLHSAAMSYWNFEKLLKVLQIDSRNFVEFDKNKIYQYGTHYRKFYFSWHHNVFSVSENLDLLKSALKQHKQVKNLLVETNFKKIFNIVEKNNRQNWLIIDYARYLGCLNAGIENDFDFSSEKSEVRSWAAYQIRFTENEIKLAGYVQTDAEMLSNDSFSGAVPCDIMTPNTDFCSFYGGTPQICRFSASHDTVSYDYAALVIDTVLNQFDKFIPADATEDSCVKFKTRSIFVANAEIADMLEARCKTRYANVLEHDGFAVFGDTVTALQYYVSKTNEMVTIVDNYLYRIANQNLPSDFVCKELYLFNNDYVRQRFFTEGTFLSQTSKSISVFGISFSTPKEGLAPTNVYFRF